jgi:hypothetical protein
MVNKTMLFGPLGRMVAIPYPESGMAFDSTLDLSEDKLLSGGLSVYRPSTTYKRFSMTWQGGASGLQPLIDMHAGAYGNGPFYLTDPMAAKSNLLPTRWASSWQLATVANGWGAPVVSNQTNTPEGQQVTFSPDNGKAPNIAFPLIPGQPIYLKAWGSRTGTGAISVYGLRKSDLTWVQLADCVPTLTNEAATQFMADDSVYSAIKLTLYCPSSSTLVLQHIDLYSTPYSFPTTGFRMGRGVGALQFTGNMAGKLTGLLVDRIGLTVDLKEVQRDPAL